MLAKLSISKKGLILVSVPIIFELVFVLILIAALKNAEHEAWKEAHYRAVVSETNNLSGLFYQATSILVSYGVMPSEESKKLFQASEETIRERMRFLATLLAENPQPSKSLAALEKTSNHVLYLMENSIAQFDSRQTSESLDKLSAYGAARAALLDLVEATRAVVDEQALAQRVNPKDQERARNQVRMSIIGGVLLNIAIAFWLAVFFGREIASRLKVILENTSKMAKGESLHVQLAGNDEIALLDRAFHEMSLAVSEANRKERAAVENALDVICSIDPSGNFIKVNPASFKQWGYTNEELIGNNLNDLIVEEDLELSQKAFKEIVEKNSTAPFENRIQHKNGTIIDLSWTAHWSEQEQAVYCIAHDISARKEAERFKQQLMQMVSHDMRTPLASMQHVNELLLMGVYGELPERVSESIRMSGKNTNRLIRLVNDFLDFEKMHAGKLDLNYASVEVSSILEESIDAVSAFASDSKIKIEAEDTDFVIEADSDRLIQVLVNLLSNAIKFSPAESTVAISVERKGAELEFSVKDQGPGIPEDARASVFQRFSKSVSSERVKKKIKGTGLGLSICKGFIEAHSGSLGVENCPKGGSRFWFRVPLNKPHE